MKTLHLLRHAKSDWSEPAVADHDRPLNRRGKRARTIVADHVAGWNVDLVMCSTARRARQTAKPVVAILGCRVQYEEATVRHGCTAPARGGPRLVRSRRVGDAGRAQPVA